MSVIGGRPKSEVPIEKIIELVDRGMTQSEIGGRFGVSRSTITDRIKEARAQGIVIEKPQATNFRKILSGRDKRNQAPPLIGKTKKTPHAPTEKFPRCVDGGPHYWDVTFDENSKQRETCRNCHRVRIFAMPEYWS